MVLESTGLVKALPQGPRAAQPLLSLAPMPPVTEEEITRAVKHAAPLKAPGPDGIPNAAIHSALPVVGPYLTHLFNACLSLGYCPKHFRESTTVVIRKPGKPDYTTPKAYRPIALLSTIGKALEA
ncbi:hypothetical protein GB937_010855, partial [Aspergillus fischeri]